MPNGSTTAKALAKPAPTPAKKAPRTVQLAPVPGTVTLDDVMAELRQLRSELAPLAAQVNVLHDTVTKVVPLIEQAGPMVSMVADTIAEKGILGLLTMAAQASRAK